MSDYDMYEFKKSDEPILIFIISLMKKLNTLKIFYESSMLVQPRNKFRASFALINFFF